MSETVLAGIEEHVEQAVTKITDLAQVHLPAIATYLQKLRANPLVTAFGSVIPGEISGDTMAVLNGLLPILVALGARGITTDQPGPASPAPAPVSGSLSAGPGGDLA